MHASPVYIYTMILFFDLINILSGQQCVRRKLWCHPLLISALSIVYSYSGQLDLQRTSVSSTLIWVDIYRSQEVLVSSSTSWYRRFTNWVIAVQFSSQCCISKELQWITWRDTEFDHGLSAEFIPGDHIYQHTRYTSWIVLIVLCRPKMIVLVVNDDWCDSAQFRLHSSWCSQPRYIPFNLSQNKYIEWIEPLFWTSSFNSLFWWASVE